MLLQLFPHSVDALQRDRGHFEGPKPTLLTDTTADDLSILLCGSDPNNSQIEFGAHQVRTTSLFARRFGWLGKGWELGMRVDRHASCGAIAELLRWGRDRETALFGKRVEMLEMRWHRAV
eukprot:2350722-Pleurochrysis_carterae.AAC.2